MKKKITLEMEADEFYGLIKDIRGQVGFRMSMGDIVVCSLRAVAENVSLIRIQRVHLDKGDEK